MNAGHVYIHVPFCARRCVYCDFSIAVRSRIPVDEYLAALEREWRLRHPDQSATLETLYFGGGTPSKLGPDGTRRMLDIVRTRAALGPRTEVTLEANPEDVTAESARAWVEAGINRVSLGVQSFNDELLSWMHRTHDASDAVRAVEVLREAGLPNVSIDLIFATPREVARQWTKDLDRALAMELPHVSLYGLTVEPRTPLGRQVARSASTEAPEEAFEQEFLEAHDRLSAAGFEHYEVSNYGRPDAHSRHNWAYWRRSPYLGFGPSAHEFDGRCRRWNTEAYAHWAAALAEGRDPISGAEELDQHQVGAEEVYLGLRTNAGIIISDAERVHVRSWVASGWAEFVDGQRLRLTAKGWLRLDAIASDLTAFRSRY